MNQKYNETPETVIVNQARDSEIDALRAQQKETGHWLEGAPCGHQRRFVITSYDYNEYGQPSGIASEDCIYCEAKAAEAERDGLRAALESVGYISTINVEHGDYWQCRFCQEETPINSETVKGARVHLQSCILYGPAPLNEAIAEHLADDTAPKYFDPDLPEEVAAAHMYQNARGAIALREGETSASVIRELRGDVDRGELEALRKFVSAFDSWWVIYHTPDDWRYTTSGTVLLDARERLAALNPKPEGGAG